MNWSILAFLFLVQTPDAFVNLDFERGKVGKPPIGWSSSMPGYRIYLGDENPKQGKFCGVIEREKVESPSSFGSLRQYIQAKPYRGKRLVFRSSVRTEPQIANNKANLFVAVYRANNERALYNNNNYHIIRTGDWKEYEIVADVCEDADTIGFGLMLEGEGRAFLDEIHIEVQDVSALGDEAPRPLEGRSLANVVAFSRLLGYVRYFYPGDEVVELPSWERFAIDGIRFVEPAKDTDELAKALEEWFHPVAPAIRIFPCAMAEQARSSFSLPKEDAIGTIYWKHLGVSGDREESDVYRSERVHLFFDEAEKKDGTAPSVEQPYFADLGGDVCGLVPLALYLSKTGPLPRNWKPLYKQAPPRAANFSPSGNDRATRLANIALSWNVFQHFYPYFDVVKTDWMSVLSQSLQAAATDTDEMAFLRTLRRMVSQLRDGHGGVRFTKERKGFIPPIAWDWIEQKLVITRTAGVDAAGIQVGDAVLSVSGRRAQVALTEMEELVSSATPQWSRYWATQLLLQGERGSVLALELEGRDGKKKEVLLPRSIALRSTLAEKLEEARPEKTAVLEPGVLYVDLDRVNDSDFNAFLPEMEKAKAIIFDLRGYPNNLSYDFLRHFFDRPFRVSPAFVPVVSFPDRQGFSFTEDLNPEIEPLKPHLGTKKIFLTNERAISYSESVMATVEFYRLGEVIGSPTAGTNGVINEFHLPGGYKITWTGMRILGHDGKKHHGIGISPSIPTSRTIQGVVEGRDELLEEALRQIRLKD